MIALSFTGSYRKTIKLRKPGLAYQEYNNGKPINLNQWFDLTKRLSQQLGTSRSSIPNKPSDKNVEGIQVTLKGYLLAVRFEKHTSQGDGKYNDFHIELGGTRNWQSPHIVVEAARRKSML
jgi:hypothetical protein